MLDANPINERIKSISTQPTRCFPRPRDTTKHSGGSSRINDLVHSGRHLAINELDTWLNTIASIMMAGMAEKYGTAQEDNRALAESCDAMVNE